MGRVERFTDSELDTLIVALLAAEAESAIDIGADLWRDVAEEARRRNLTVRLYGTPIVPWECDPEDPFCHPGGDEEREIHGT